MGHTVHQSNCVLPTQASVNPKTPCLTLSRNYLRVCDSERAYVFFRVFFFFLQIPPFDFLGGPLAITPFFQEKILQHPSEQN